jgi:hypothetical protein
MPLKGAELLLAPLLVHISSGSAVCSCEGPAVLSWVLLIIPRTQMQLETITLWNVWLPPEVSLDMRLDNTRVLL